MDKEDVVHIYMEYYSAIKKNEIMPYAATWMQIEIIILSEVSQKESCTPMFIAVLFTIARTWKQPKCPSTDEWIKKMGHIYTMEYYSAIKKNEIE